MVKQKLTSRQIQAIKTKNKIYNTAVKLMEEKGFNNITIEDISKKAGVSVGSFYNYYKSKEDIFFEIYLKADEYFKNEVAPQLKQGNLNTFEQIILFFKCYGDYNAEQGLENARQLYNTKNKLFIDKNRYMINLMKEIISNGQEKNQIFMDMAADEITSYLFIVSRGVVMDWCLHDADYDLSEKLGDFIRRLVVIFKANP